MRSLNRERPFQVVGPNRLVRREGTPMMTLLSIGYVALLAGLVVALIAHAGGFRSHGRSGAISAGVLVVAGAGFLVAALVAQGSA